MVLSILELPTEKRQTASDADINRHDDGITRVIISFSNVARKRQTLWGYRKW